MLSTDLVRLVVSACNLIGGLDLSGIIPKYINIRRGALLVFVVGCVMQPWSLLNGANVFLTVMSSYGIFLAPLTGIIHSDYYLLRRRRISLYDFYDNTADSPYSFFYGVNWRALVPFFFAQAPLFPGFIAKVRGIDINEGLSHLYFLVSDFATSEIFLLTTYRRTLTATSSPEECTGAFRNSSHRLISVVSMTLTSTVRLGQQRPTQRAGSSINRPVSRTSQACLDLWVCLSTRRVAWTIPRTSLQVTLVCMRFQSDSFPSASPWDQDCLSQCFQWLPRRGFSRRTEGFGLEKVVP